MKSRHLQIAALGLLLTTVLAAPTFAQELNFSNFRQKLEFFSQSASKSKDYENLLLVLADQWSPKTETAIPVLGFLSRYFSIEPAAFSAFERIKNKFKSPVWVTMIEEVYVGKYDALRDLVELNREYGLMPDFDWFGYFADSSPTLLDAILNQYEERFKEDGRVAWASDLKRRAKGHDEVLRLIDKRKGEYFDLLRNSTLEQLEKEARDQDLKSLKAKN